MIFDKFSSLKGFALLFYTAVTLVALYLLFSTGDTPGKIAGTANTICNAVVIWRAYRKFNTNK